MKRPAEAYPTPTGHAASPEPDSAVALDLVMQLLAIPGTSGEEGAVAQFIVDQLRRAGAPSDAICTDAAHRRAPIAGESGNLFFHLPGTWRGPRRLLMAHLDTVPLCVGCRPVLRGSVIRSADAHTGLGADDRAGVAVVLNTALEILRRGLPHPPLTFLWTVQEEIGLHGARLVRKGLLKNPALAFNWDGGAAEKLTIGATGGYRLQIEIAGLASHAGGAPEQGISAIAIASLAIAQLQRTGWHGAIVKSGKRGTSNIGSIHGGQATNVVPDAVSIKAEARSHDASFRKRIVEEIEKAFLDAANEVKNVAGKTGRVKIAGRLDYESFLLRSDEPCVKAARDAVSAIGKEPELAIANGGVDANWMVAHGIPTVTLGCGQRDQHMSTESLDVRVYQQACRVGLHLATGKICG